MTAVARTFLSSGAALSCEAAPSRRRIGARALCVRARALTIMVRDGTFSSGGGAPAIPSNQSRCG
eukprot:1702332-Prymnesium_polylepis.1